MSQCVPSWDLDAPPNPSPHHIRSSSSAPPQLSMSDYEVAELTWSNGHLLAHGLSKPTPKYPPSTAGTLESVVDQAKLLHPTATAADWHPAAGSPNTNHLPATADAQVPTHRRQREELASGIGSCDGGDGGRKRARVRDQPTATTRSIDSMKMVVDETDEIGFATTNSVTPFADDGNGVSGSPDTENTSFGGGGGSRPITTAEDHDSVCHSQRSLSQVRTTVSKGSTYGSHLSFSPLAKILAKRNIVGEEDEKANERGTMRSTVSTKRSRAAAVHNQSERKRRDRINQKMRTLQKLVPNSSKTDKASMLDEVIDYLKQLQAQAHMMSRMSSMPAPMMMPMSMQQFQMTMMAQMAQLTQMARMGMGMGMGMGAVDMASLGRAGPAGISPVMRPASSATFLPMIAPASSWDPSAGAPERMLPAGAVMPMPEPFSAFVPCPTQQSMTMDAYQRMAALYPQMFQQSQPTNPK